MLFKGFLRGGSLQQHGVLLKSKFSILFTHCINTYDNSVQCSTCYEFIKCFLDKEQLREWPGNIHHHM